MLKKRNGTAIFRKKNQAVRLSELSLIADTGGIYEGEQTEEELEKEMENLQNQNFELLLFTFTLNLSRYASF